MDDETHKNLYPIIQVAVRRTAHKWRRHLEPSELFSIAWLWCYDHPSAIRKYSDDEDNRRATKRLTIALCKALDSAGRREKAAREGYAPEDEAFYTANVIEAVLPHVLTGSYQQPATGDDSPTRKPVPGPGMGWETMLLDVQHGYAMAELSTDQVTAMSLRFKDGEPFNVIGRVLGVSESTARNRVQEGVRAVRDALGGPSPHCDSRCECVGTRRVLSSAQARAVTDGQYDPD